MPARAISARVTSIRTIVAASAIGTTIEWYDFLIYATAASLVLNKLFFPTDDPLVGKLISISTVGVGFFARPFGAVVLSHFGDRLGRKSPLILTMVSMGLATTLIGLLPTYASIGIAAPILLPVATRAGIDPLQYGIVLTMAVGIGVFLPPIGIGYYIACAIGEAPVNATMRPSLIYSAFLVLGLVIVVLFPQITTWIPHFFGMH